MEFHVLCFTFLLLSVYVSLYSGLAVGTVEVVKTITVDKSGNGNFKTIQEAINSVPNGNLQWIRVQVHQGIYMYI
jgi:pectin methylesterase-like acyl-CoA thioesterase